MNILTWCGFVLIVAVLCVMVRKYNPEFSILISVAVGILFIGIMVSQIVPAFSQVSRLIAATGLSSEYGLILFKALGVCFLTQFASDACKDAGESALSSKIELAGRIAIAVLSLPLFEKIAETATFLIGG